MIAKADDFEEIFVDMEMAEVNAFVRNLLPEVTRKEGVKEEYIEEFCSNVLGKDVFNPTGKPENVPGGFIIRGEGKVKPIDGKDYGDLLIDALDKKMAKTSLVGKIQAYYILDPTPASGEEIMNEEDEQPLILVTNADISPTTNALVKPGVSFLGLASICIFALGSFSFNEEMMNQLSQTPEGFDGLYDLSLPLALAILSTQLVHETGHLIFALKEGINVGLPTLVPGIQFGLSGSITPIKSSPKNIKALFDFSIAGPLFGIIASVILLYNGLEITAFMGLEAREQLPSIPVETLRISALGGGAIEYLLGDGILNSPNPAADLIKLHPYAIAGFGGLVTNALSLLPIGNTDGGRIAVAFFGRSFARVAQGFFILSLAFAGLFGADQTNVLLCYAIFTQFWQKEPEVPCRNEVDELDAVRGFIAIATSVVVFLILTPMN
uniref:Peptidase M50 domain-containing protein n=1 Tax=Skeletonema marinoi TaxID=267567 RepID=A0A7S2PW85_9STRA